MLKKIYSVMLLVCVCLLFLCSNSYANGVKIEEDEVYSYKGLDNEMAFYTYFFNAGGFFSNSYQGVLLEKVFENNKPEPVSFLSVKAYDKRFRKYEKVDMDFIINGQRLNLQNYLVDTLLDKESGIATNIYDLPESFFNSLPKADQIVCVYSSKGIVIKNVKLPYRHILAWQKTEKMDKNNYIRNGLVVENPGKALSRDGDWEIYLPNVNQKDVLNAIQYKILGDFGKYEMVESFRKNKEDIDNYYLAFEGREDFSNTNSFITFVALPYKDGTLFKMLKNRRGYGSRYYGHSKETLSDMITDGSGAGLIDMRGSWLRRIENLDQLFIDTVSEFADTAYYGIDFAEKMAGKREDGNIHTVEKIKEDMRGQYQGITVGSRLKAINGTDVSYLRKEEIEIRLMKEKQGANFIFFDKDGNEKQVFAEPKILKGNSNGKINYTDYFLGLKKPIKYKYDNVFVDDVDVSFSYQYLKDHKKAPGVALQFEE